MTEFKYFRHMLTGKVGFYPEDFGDLFYDTFVEVDSNAADCEDCWLKDDDNDERELETVPDDVEDFDETEDAPDLVAALYNDENKDK